MYLQELISIHFIEIIGIRKVFFKYTKYSVWPSAGRPCVTSILLAHMRSIGRSIEHAHKQVVVHAVDWTVDRTCT